MELMRIRGKMVAGRDLNAGREELEETLAAEANLLSQLTRTAELYLWSN